MGFQGRSTVFFEGFKKKIEGFQGLSAVFQGDFWGFQGVSGGHMGI